MMKNDEGEARNVRTNGQDDGRALTDEQRAILDLEESWVPRSGKKSRAIHELGMSESRYYIVLSQLLENPLAELDRPELVRRMRRLRDRRARERHGRDMRADRSAARGNTVG
ncbi:DUF3263 domain-containing protein [Arcanobacterium haemolyticum]|nr:DUF3263 domain-containing protein [Arcanobacterium haemolyticum]